MSAMEDSLRRALEGGDASDPAFRESIYAASERALERMLSTRQSSEAEAFEQRSRLAATIDRVEADYAADPASGAGAFHDEVDRDDGPGPQDWDRDEAGVSQLEADDPRAPRAFAPAAASSAAAEEEGEVWTPGGERAPPRRRSPFLVPVVAVVIAVVLAILGYTIGGAVRGSDGAAPAAGDQAALPAIDWIDVFDGNNLEQLSTPNGGRIETVPRPSGGEAVRLAGPEGGEGEVMLAIGPGIVSQITGHDVRIELTAGSPDGALREFSVRCLFGAESVCDRQRFSTAMDEEAFVFDVTVPVGAASPASIALGPGLNGTPNDANLYSVRIRTLN